MKSEWRIVALGEIVNDYDALRIPLSTLQRQGRKGGYPYYGAQGVIDGVDGYIFDGTYLLIAEDGENLKSMKNDVARLAVGKFWVNNHAHVLENNEKCDIRFLCYLLNSIDLAPYITGSAQPKLNKKNLFSIELSIPSLATQRKIAAVLSSLDDKIETNNAICRNLEEMSRCVLSEWLTAEAHNVEYIPLSELADINAKTYSEKEKWPFVYYLDTGSITNGRVDSLAYIDVNKEKLPSRARRKISMGDIVYSTVRPTQRHFGIIYDVQPNMLVSTGFAVICSNCTDVCNELIYIMLTDPTFVESMQQIGEQSVSTYPSVNPADIATCSIPVSKEVSYQKIQDVIQSNFKKIGDLQKENCRLASLRDTLLPRLMSGELDVSAVKL